MSGHNGARGWTLGTPPAVTTPNRDALREGMVSTIVDAWRAAMTDEATVLGTVRRLTDVLLEGPLAELLAGAERARSIADAAHAVVVDLRGRRVSFALRAKADVLARALHGD